MIIVAILGSVVSAMVGFLAGCMRGDSARADEKAAQQIDTLARMIAIYKARL